MSHMKMLTHRGELRRSKDFHVISHVLDPQKCKWYTSLPVMSSKTSRRNRRRRRRGSSSGSESMTKKLGSRHAEIVLNLMESIRVIFDVHDESENTLHEKMMFDVIAVHGKRTPPSRYWSQSVHRRVCVASCRLAECFIRTNSRTKVYKNILEHTIRHYLSSPVSEEIRERAVLILEFALRKGSIEFSST